MIKFMNRDPADVSKPWKELHVQAYVVMELRRMGYIVHGDGNGLSLSPRGRMEKKLGGAQVGWPDLTVLLDGGRPLYVELKVGAAVSRDQSSLHKQMRELGYRVEVVRADCPTDGLFAIMEILDGR